MLTKFETDMIARAVYALETIADELRTIRELKTQDISDKKTKKSDKPKD